MPGVDELHRSTPVELKARRDAERSGIAHLVYRDRDGRQRLLMLGRDRSAVSIGRQAVCDVALTWDPEVSRAHADLERRGDVWTIVDDGRSRNGTYVNGERLHGRRVLRHRDAITVGRTTITFSAPGAETEGSTLAAERPVAPVLSPAQRRVLVALCRPFAESRFAAPPANHELATALCVSVETVKYHLHVLFGLFGLEHLPQHRKRAALARLALERGVVTRRELRTG